MSRDVASKSQSKKNWKLALGFFGVFALGATTTYGLMMLDNHLDRAPQAEATQDKPTKQLKIAGIKKPERTQVPVDQMWDDFDQQFAQIQKEMNQRFNTFFGDVKDSFYEQAFQVSEAREGNQIIVKIDLGDVDENSVEVNIDNQLIHIKGERSVSEENKGQFGSSVTRSVSSFSKAFSLPEGASPNGAKVEKGSGEITIVFDRTTV